MSGSRMSSTQVNEVLCRDEVKALVKAVNFGGIHLVFSVDGNILTLKKKLQPVFDKRQKLSEYKQR